MRLSVLTHNFFNSMRDRRPINMEAPWEVAHSGNATHEDIFYCFRLLLGRSPNKEEWKGHSAHAGQTRLDDVVMSYVNSLEFSRRKNRILSKSWNEDLYLKQLDKFSIYAREGDAAVGRGVKTGIYEPNVTSVFQNRLKPGMHVLDIGANIGYFTMLSAALVGPAGSVMAIEPNPENAKLIELSRRANGFENITIVQAGAGRALGLLVLNTAYSNGTTSALSGDAAELADAITVPSLRLDDIVPPDKQIGFIKIDIEGAEYNALLGASNIIKRCHPVIVSEFSPGLIEGISNIGARDYLKYILDFGYSVSVIETNGDLTACGQDVDKVMQSYADCGGDHIDVIFD